MYEYMYKIQYFIIIFERTTKKMIFHNVFAQQSNNKIQHKMLVVLFLHTALVAELQTI